MGVDDGRDTVDGNDRSEGQGVNTRGFLNGIYKTLLLSDVQKRKCLTVNC